MREKVKKGKHNPTQKETLKKFLAPVLEKIAGTVREKVSSIDWKRSFIRNIPYFIVFYLADKVGWLYRCCIGDSFIERVGVLFLNFSLAFRNVFPSVHPLSLIHI